MQQKDFSYAARFRDSIRRIVKTEINRERPRATLATVLTVNVTNKIAYVLFPGENMEAPVSLGALIPDVGSVVLVDGPADGRYVSDIVSGTFRLSNDVIPGPPGPTGPPGAGSGTSTYLGTWPSKRGTAAEAATIFGETIPPSDRGHFYVGMPAGTIIGAGGPTLANNTFPGDNPQWWVVGDDSAESRHTTNGHFAGVTVTIPDCEFIMADVQMWVQMRYSDDANQFMPGADEPASAPPSGALIAMTHNNRLWDNHRHGTFTGGTTLIDTLQPRIPSGGYVPLISPVMTGEQHYFWTSIRILSSPRYGFGTSSESLFDSGVGNTVDIGFALKQGYTMRAGLAAFVDLSLTFMTATIWALGVR